MVFSVPSGRSVSTFFGFAGGDGGREKGDGDHPVTINVRPLPLESSGELRQRVVGTFTLNPSISTTQARANGAITLRLEISGTGNMKLIRDPIVQFPDNFEVYDPTVNNSLNVTTNGLTGVRTVEYMAIPRYEGSYSDPPVGVHLLRLEQQLL